MKTTSVDALSKRIEEAIQDHMNGVRMAVQEAVVRAFLSMPAAGNATAASSVPALERDRVPKKRAPLAPRRTPEQLQALADKLYAQVSANPGVTMAALALKMELPSSSLAVPMAALRRDEKIRHVGERGMTQYFPQACAGAQEDGTS